MNQSSLHTVNRLLDMMLKMPEEPGDLTNALRYLVRSARTIFAADICVIFALHPITGEFISSFTIDENTLMETPSVGERPKRNGFTRKVLRKGELFVEDLLTAPQYQGNFTRANNVRAFAALALRTRHQRKPLGVLYLDFKHKRRFHEDERELLRSFAAQASFILQETWLLRRYQMVAEIGKDINLAFENIDVLFHKLRTGMVDILDASHCLLLAVLELPTKTLDLYRDERGCFSQETKTVEGIYKHVIETREPLVIRHLSQEDDPVLPQMMSTARMNSGESLMFLPLMFRDIILGVVSVQHAHPHAYNEEDLFVLQLLANHIALAVLNMRLYSSLRLMNETGRLFTQQLDSEQVLQATTEKILEATKADVVVLYPYDATTHQFQWPPRIAGSLDHPAFFATRSSARPNDTAVLLVEQDAPIFAKESASIYRELLDEQDVPSGRFALREQICSTAALPLRVKDEVVGVLFVNFRQSQRFDSPQKILIEGLAHFAAVAIKNAQIFGTLNRRHEREAEILRDVDRELSRALDLKQTLRIILTLANELLQADKASVLLHDTHDHLLRGEVHIGPAATERLPLSILLSGVSTTTTGITRWVFEHKQAACVRDVHHEHPWSTLYIPTIASTTSELDVPLIDGDEVIGVFNFESAREGAFLAEDQNFLITLAGQVVIAIKNAQVYEREKRLADEGQTLNDISKEMISQLDHLRIFNLIVEKALLLTGSANGLLSLYEPRSDELRIVAERSVSQKRKLTSIALNQGVVGYVARTKELLNVDPSLPPWNEINLEFVPGARSELVVPMLASGGVLRGVIDIESPEPDKFTQRDERLLKGLADLAVIALQNAELYEKAEEDAKRFSLLYTAGKELSNISSGEQLTVAYDVILRLAEEQSKGVVVIRRIDENTQELVVECASQGQSQQIWNRISIAEGANGVALRERRTVMIADTRKPTPEAVPILPPHSAIRSLVIVPIQFDDRNYGTLGFASDAVGYFHDADIPFFEGLAQQLASTLYRIETVRERQAFEQRAFAAEVMSTLGQSAYELTHRLGNALGLVDSYADSIQTELKHLHIRHTVIDRKLENIVQAVRTVLSLSGNLRSGLASLSASEEIHEQPVVLAPQRLFVDVQMQVNVPPSITMKTEIEPDVACISVLRLVTMDILHNLISNAVEALSAEGGQILLRARNVGRTVALEVADTGPGISEPLKSKVFELFFSTKGSSGFGLWSARRNALRNHGELRVESQPGQGTTFTLLLPRVRSGQKYHMDE